MKASGTLQPQQHNGTIEVPDCVPKREYYTSLRRFGTMGRHGSISGGSMLGGGVSGAPVTAVGSPYASTTLGRTTNFGQSNTSVQNFKPSGKTIDCAVIMLDGLQQMFSIDVSIEVFLLLLFVVCFLSDWDVLKALKNL